jgi:hypothetical protein
VRIGIAVGDNGFELPAQASPPDYQYRPTGTPWKFSGPAGVAGDASAFTYGNPFAPEGTQVAFLQDRGAISQGVNFGPGGTFTIEFQAAQRANVQNGGQVIEVLVDGRKVDTITPAGTGYAGNTTAAFTVKGGHRTIEFLGLDPNGLDNTAFIDQVSITPTA